MPVQTSLYEASLSRRAGAQQERKARRSYCCRTGTTTPPRQPRQSACRWLPHNALEVTDAPAWASRPEPQKVYKCQTVRQKKPEPKLVAGVQRVGPIIEERERQAEPNPKPHVFQSKEKADTPPFCRCLLRAWGLLVRLYLFHVVIGLAQTESAPFVGAPRKYLSADAECEDVLSTRRHLQQQKRAASQLALSLPLHKALSYNPSVPLCSCVHTAKALLCLFLLAVSGP